MTNCEVLFAEWCNIAQLFIPPWHMASDVTSQLQVTWPDTTITRNSRGWLCYKDIIIIISYRMIFALSIVFFLPLWGGDKDFALCFSFDFCRLSSRSFWSFHVLNVSSAFLLLSLFSSSLNLRSSLCTALSFFINSSSSCFCLSQFLNAACPTPRLCSAISSFNWAAFLSSAAIF